MDSYDIRWKGSAERDLGNIDRQQIPRIVDAVESLADNPLEGGDDKMIKNREQIREFERELIRKEKTDVTKNFQIVDAMYHEAVELGIIPMRDPLDGLEIDIRIAEVLNYVPEADNKNSKGTK